MPLFERSANDILQSALTDLSNNSRINRQTPGSKARAILESVSKNLNLAYKTFDINLAKSFLSGASGQYIDLIGELVNTPRLGTSVASASASTKVVKFYVATGNFGAINSSTNIIIPAGTIISTQTNSGGILYKTRVGVTLNTSATEQFIDVEALSPGESYNVTAGILTFHNFTNYTDNVNNSLLVTNVAGIFSGSNIEDDINYKFRISRAVTSSEAANQTAILLACISVPGVANVILQNRSSGIGTYKILIKSITPSVSSSLIDDVQANLINVVGLGTYPVVDKPRETGLEVQITVIYHNGVSVSDQDSIEDAIKSSIFDYVDNLDIGEQFVFNKLVSVILNTSPSIKDIGLPNAPIDNLYVYKETRLRDSKIRNNLLSDYTPAQDERVILEPSLQNPITIIRKINNA